MIKICAARSRGYTLDLTVILLSCIFLLNYLFSWFKHFVNFLKVTFNKVIMVQIKYIFYAPLGRREGILLCTCWSVERSVGPSVCNRFVSDQ